MKNNDMRPLKVWSSAVQLVVLSLILLLSQLTLAKDRIQYHVQNFDGSTLKVINEQGIVSQSYQYAPFGQQLQLKKPSNLKNPNAFVGGVQDAGDLVYLKQRHYNPVLGRFYQPDPITFLSGGHGQTNRYQYGWNDTYHFTDANGEAAVVRNGVWVDDGTNFYSSTGGGLTDLISQNFASDLMTLAPLPKFNLVSKAALFSEKFVPSLSYQIALNKNILVWDFIKPTAAAMPGTYIPKSFELMTTRGVFWVHPNATKHMLEYLTRNTPSNSLGSIRMINNQAMLLSLQSAVSQAATQGIKYEKLIDVGQWELRFSMRSGDRLPVLMHAVYNK
ncbi:RHS repeat domain-containing protein [Acinetobacter colistiniresistens]|nr:RHS repeat-associated core domain-containing protein [Acinetobacter colistiniresistens]